MAKSPKKAASTARAGGRKTASSAGSAARSAARRNTENGKMYIKKEAEQDAARQVPAIVLFAAAVFVLCVTLIPGGGLWEELQKIFFGLSGAAAFVWPLIMLYTAVMLSLDKEAVNIRAKLIEAAILVLLICGAIHIFAGGNSFPLSFAERGKDYLKAVSLGYTEGSLGFEGKLSSSGGAFGALIGGFLLLLFAAKLPAAVTVSLLIFVFLLLMTGTTLVSFFESVTKPVRLASKGAETHFEEAARAREERKQQREQEQPFNPDVSLGPEPEKYDFFGDEYEVPEPSEAEKRAAVGSFGTQLDLSSKLKNLKIDDGDLSGADKKASESEAPNAKEKSLAGAIGPAGAIGSAGASGAEGAAKDGGAACKKGLEAEAHSYVRPPLDCLAPAKLSFRGGQLERELERNALKLINVLESFGIRASGEGITRGPSVTRYDIRPADGVRVSRITGLASDIALSLAVSSVRIVPVAGKSAIGIEVPNKKRDSVGLREILEDPAYIKAERSGKLTVALRRDIAGKAVYADLAKMPHLLVAGTTGSGKSSCLTAMILSLLYNTSPEELRLILIDPKKGVEFMTYNGLPHLLLPVIAETEKASGALSWAIKEMEKRYLLFAEADARDLDSYNKKAREGREPEKYSVLPRLVIFIDEFADLMMSTPSEVERLICRLAQLGRAAGIHLVVATQRPEAKIVTGLIKSNIPSRIALSVQDALNSRIILDQTGAENLLGTGDLLFRPQGLSTPVRVQGCFVSEKEVRSVTGFIKEREKEHSYSEEIIKAVEDETAALKSKDAPSETGRQKDALFNDAAQLVIDTGQASASFLQRKLQLGYARAARIIDELEESGIVGPCAGSKPRDVLVTRAQWLERKALSSDEEESG